MQAAPFGEVPAIVRNRRRAGPGDGAGAVDVAGGDARTDRASLLPPVGGRTRPDAAERPLVHGLVAAGLSGVETWSLHDPASPFQCMIGADAEAAGGAYDRR